MMDAVKFLKKKNQICKEYGKRPGECFICPLGNDEGGCQVGAFENQKIAEEDLVQIVEKYAAENPVKTRQSELLKIIPDAKTLNGILDLCPERIVRKFDCDEKPCPQCREKYWLEEVE